MLNVTTPAAAPAACEPVAVCELSDAELDLVAAAGSYHGAFVDISVGNIAIGFQVNNQVNVAILSFGSVQGGSQTNINNSGNLITTISH